MPQKKHPKRPRRSESFLGIHFDKHMNADCKRVGENVTRRMVEQIIDRVGPDYIQVDCKGHPGFTSYPTKVGTPAPGFVRDQMKIWREVTKRRGVGLFMHYSGVFDREAVRRHPSWARIDEKGNRDKQNTSVFGPYVDKLLIPQLKELCDDYGVDGVWIDGDCWACGLDYSKWALAAWRQETGIRSVPRKESDPHFARFMEFCREGFRRYLGHYVDELHRHDPDFQIASNWAYSSFMPEPVGTNVDFISGDYPLIDSVNAARFEARAMARQGKPWDLMAWSFAGRFGKRPYSTKSVVQLQQEAAQVVAVGGGFQAYFKQKPDGSINDWTMKLMGEVARFCRARQATCHGAEAVPQIALLYSGANMRKKSRNLFRLSGPQRSAIRGALQCLLDGQHAVEVLVEHQLSGRMKEYPLIVIPECDYLEPRFRKELTAYVREGGNLLLIGPEAAKMFRKELGVRFVGRAEERTLFFEHNGWMSGIKGLNRRIKVERKARPFGKLYAQNDVKGPSETAASVARLGKGRIAACYTNIGTAYLTCRTALQRDFLSELVGQIFPNPIVTVTGSSSIDVVLTRKDGKLLVNLLNTAGPHGDENVYVFDEVPPAGPLDVKIRRRGKPKKVSVMPSGRRIRLSYSRGVVRLTLPKLELHEVIVVE